MTAIITKGVAIIAIKIPMAKAWLETLRNPKYGSGSSGPNSGPKIPVMNPLFAVGIFPEVGGGPETGYRVSPCSNSTILNLPLFAKSAAMLSLNVSIAEMVSLVSVTPISMV